MPELPEVESVRRQLCAIVEGRRITSVSTVPQRRFLAVERAEGARLGRLRRRGKYLIADIDGPFASPGELIVHLGMTGSFRVRGEVGPDGVPWTPDDYVRASFTFDDGTVLDFRDVRRFGRIAVVDAGDHRDIPTLAALGPEPLEDGFTAREFADALARTTAPVKVVLLGQRVVAGVGNIYADEALWRARIDPRSRQVGRARAARLHAAVRQVLAEAVEREGTTFRDYQMVNGSSGRFADFLVAYGQAGRPCSRCAAPLRKITLGGRGTTFCPRCQRR